MEARPLVVVGSANADIYVEVDRLPAIGETIAARSGHTLPGGKGANQAASASRLSFPTFFIGQVKFIYLCLSREILVGFYALFVLIDVKSRTKV